MKKTARNKKKSISVFFLMAVFFSLFILGYVIGWFINKEKLKMSLAKQAKIKNFENLLMKKLENKIRQKQI